MVNFRSSAHLHVRAFVISLDIHGMKPKRTIYIRPVPPIERLRSLRQKEHASIDFSAWIKHARVLGASSKKERSGLFKEHTIGIYSGTQRVRQYHPAQVEHLSDL